MSGLIQASLNLNVVNGGYNRSVINSASISQALQKVDEAILNVGTSEQDVSELDIVSNGYIYLCNLGGGCIDYGSNTGGHLAPLGRLLAGEFAWFRLISDGSPGSVATATASVSSGVVTGVTISSAGAGYASLTTGLTASGPVIKFTGGGGSGAIANVSGYSGGGINTITVTNGGSGYTTAPTVSFVNATLRVIATSGGTVGPLHYIIYNN